MLLIMNFWVSTPSCQNCLSEIFSDLLNRRKTKNAPSDLQRREGVWDWLHDQLGNKVAGSEALQPWRQSCMMDNNMPSAALLVRKPVQHSFMALQVRGKFFQYFCCWGDQKKNFPPTGRGMSFGICTRIQWEIKNLYSYLYWSIPNNTTRFISSSAVGV